MGEQGINYISYFIYLLWGLLMWKNIMDISFNIKLPKFIKITRHFITKKFFKISNAEKINWKIAFSVVFLFLLYGFMSRFFVIMLDNILGEAVGMCEITETEYGEGGNYTYGTGEFVPCGYGPIGSALSLLILTLLYDGSCKKEIDKEKIAINIWSDKWDCQKEEFFYNLNIKNGKVLYNRKRVSYMTFRGNQEDIDFIKNILDKHKVIYNYKKYDYSFKFQYSDK